MRTLSSSLTVAQKAGFVKALVKVVLTKGASTYTYDKTRILPSKHDEELYSQIAEVVLHNRDGVLNDLSFKGYTGVISYGAVTSAGEEYSATAPLYVTDQQFNSNPNELSCVLSLEGIPNVMARDEASENYIPKSDDTLTVKDLVEGIVGATLAAFTHCKAFEVVWDAGYDTLADSYKSADGFRIYTGGKRLAALRRVLDYTGNVPRFEDDGKCHILKPVTTGVVFDSTYSLERDAHKFFAKAYRDTVPFPNKVVVRSRTDDDPYCSGEAQISTYGSLADNIKNTAFIEARLTSDDQANDIAEALIAKAEMGCKKGQAEVPLNVGAEIFDYVQVTDSRQGDTRSGNLGYVHRRFGQDKWTMTFGFGNWFDMLKYRDMLKQLEIYTDSGNYFAVLQVGQLYAYLDDIKDGPDLYIRQNYLHLDATGVYVSENTLYAVRIPGEAQHNLWKQTTAPTDKATSDFWLDTNYTPNKVMIWNGSSWVEATSAQLAEFGSASILRIWKSSALTADGLVVLDETQEGTYGKVKKASLTAAGLILLDQTVDGSYGKILVNDISSGHVKGTAIVQSSGARLVTDSEKSDWNDAYDLALDAYDIGIEAIEGVEANLVYGYATFNAFATAKGEWYKLAGVKITGTSGIDIFGPNTGLRTRSSDGGTIQCYVGSDGAIYAGGGKIKLDSTAVKIVDAALVFYYSTFSSQKGYMGGYANDLRIVSTGDNSILIDSDYNLTLQADGNIFMNPGSGSYVEVLSNMRMYANYLRVPLLSEDPSGTNGAIYYNTTTHEFRGYRAGAWRNIQS